MFDNVVVTSNDLVIKAYGKKLGIFTADKVYIAIPFPVSLFEGGREVVVEYKDVVRLSLMQSNSDLSIYVAYNKNGKIKGHSVGVGNETKSAIVYFEKACTLIKNTNPEVEVHMAPGVTNAIGRMYANKEKAIAADKKKSK